MCTSKIHTISMTEIWIIILIIGWFNISSEAYARGVFTMLIIDFKREQSRMVFSRSECWIIICEAHALSGVAIKIKVSI